MDTATKLRDTLNEKTNEFKSKMEEFALHANLGRSEVAETFEREWRTFSRYVEEQGNRLKGMEFFSQHELDELEKLLPKLQSMLTEPAPATDKAFTFWRERVMRGIYEVEFLIKKLYPTLDEEGRELFSRLRVKLEIYRTQLVMAKLNGLGATADEATAVRTICEETLAWRERHREAFKNRVEDFGQDVRSLFDRMKGTVSEFFK